MDTKPNYPHKMFENRGTQPCDPASTAATVTMLLNRIFAFTPQRTKEQELMMLHQQWAYEVDQDLNQYGEDNYYTG